MRSAEEPGGSEEIRIWAGVAPGSEEWLHPEQATGDTNRRIVWDVSVPVLSTFFTSHPASGNPALIILPGGGGRILPMDGPEDLAKFSADSGVTAYILKYRTRPLQLTPEELAEQLRIFPASPPVAAGEERLDFDAIQREVARPNEFRMLQVSDLVEAVAKIRATGRHEQIFVAGLSNGGIVLVEALEQTQLAASLAGAAAIYGVPPREVSPTNVPLYLAVAADDRLTARQTLPVYSTWVAAGYGAELHVYGEGGHGFAATGSTASRGWKEDLLRWIR